MNALFAAAAAVRLCPAWAVLLCTALAFAPSARLHVHEVDHPAPLAGVLGALEGIGGEHFHVPDVHTAAASSHDDHHDGVSMEFDASPKLAVKKVLNSTFAVALLTIATLALLVPTRIAPFAGRFSGARAPPKRYHLVRPVRAPPPR